MNVFNKIYKELNSYFLVTREIVLLYLLYSIFTFILFKSFEGALNFEFLDLISPGLIKHPF